MWFSVAILMRSKNGLWEEQVRVIDADSESAARETAREIGRKEEHGYATADGGWTEWRFEAISSVCAVDFPALEAAASGTEIFWRFLRESEALSLLTPFEDDE
jgi:uncharacterized protein DUF4288